MLDSFSDIKRKNCYYKTAKWILQENTMHCADTAEQIIRIKFPESMNTLISKQKELEEIRKEKLKDLQLTAD